MQQKPQQIVRFAAPGSLLKRAIGIAQRMREVATGHDPAYLAMVRQCPCLRCGLDPCGEAAHLRAASGAYHKRSGMGKKPEDKWALPLCAACHREDADSQHKIGESVFWHLVGLNPFRACVRLYAQRDNIAAMRAIAFQLIGERK